MGTGLADISRESSPIAGAEEGTKMIENISEVVRPLLGGKSLDRVSGWIGEGPNETKRALESAIPASVAGLADYTSDERNARSLVDRFRADDYPHMETTDAGRVLSDPQASEKLARGGGGFAESIFGDKFGRVTEGIAESSGARPSSVSKLFGLAMPLVLGAVGKQVSQRHLDARGLSSFLGEQKGSVASMLSGPLGFLGGAGRGGDGERMGEHVRGEGERIGERVRGVGERVRGEGERVGERVRGEGERVGERVRGEGERVGERVRGEGERVGERVRGEAHEARGGIAERGRRAVEEGRGRVERLTHERGEHREPGGGLLRYLPWLLAGLLAFLALMWFLGRRGQEAAPPRRTDITQPARPEARAPAAPSPEARTPEAPSARAPAAPEAAAPGVSTSQGATVGRTAVAEMARYLSANPESPRRFGLGGLDFAIDSATLTGGGREVANDLASVLKENPDATIRIEGYTDATGDPAANMSLSKERADTLERHLVEQGVSADRIETAGMGSNRPIAPNTTEEGREQNRRVEVVIAPG